MNRAVLLSACATGGFCAIFAVVVDFFAGMLSLSQVMGVAAMSGFLGSLFAHFVVGKRVR